MRVSKFSEKQKNDILNEKEEYNLTISSICEKHGISVPTYYIWKRKAIENNLSKEINSDHNTSDLKIREENSTLRRLYINLSEHNYQLAKFLNKQA